MNTNQTPSPGGVTAEEAMKAAQRMQDRIGIVVEGNPATSLSDVVVTPMSPEEEATLSHIRGINLAAARTIPGVRTLTFADLTEAQLVELFTPFIPKFLTEGLLFMRGIGGVKAHSTCGQERLTIYANTATGAITGYIDDLNDRTGFAIKNPFAFVDACRKMGLRY